MGRSVSEKSRDARGASPRWNDGDKDQKKRGWGGGSGGGGSEGEELST